MATPMSTVIEAAPRPAVALGLRQARVIAFWGLLLAKLAGGWGVQWDIRWHLVIGRDSFWIAPHLLTYAGVVLVAALSLGILAAETWRERAGRPVPGGVRVFGLTGTPGFHLAWWGIALTILAAPVDDLWHRLFGLDVTLWSPPHLLGLAGAQVNSVACLLIALELWPPAAAVRRVALVGAGALLLGAFYITVDPGVQTAFRRGGVFFFTWPILCALAAAFTLTLVARLSGWRLAPVATGVVALAVHWMGIAVGDAGFALLRPVPALEEAIAAGPDSPIALAQEMARRNGTTPGRSSALRIVPLAGIALMALVDARRRPRAAAVALGLALLAACGAVFWRAPAYAHALPSLPDVAAAAALAALAGVAGAALAVRLARPLAADRITPPA